MKQVKDSTEIIKGWEIFPDPSFYDMWAVRKVGITDFYQTMHVLNRQMAIDMINTITEEKQILLNEIKSKFENDPYWVYRGLNEFIDKKLSQLK